MVALLVVLGDHLPVGGQLVGVPVDDDQVLRPVRRDDVLPDPRRGRRTRRPRRWGRRTASRASSPAAARRARTASASKPSTFEKCGALRRLPSSRYDHEWYGHTMLRPLVVALHASSSWPRCRQVLANARTVSSPRTSSTAFAPVPTAFCAPTRGQVGGVADAGPPGEDVPLLPFEDRGVDVGFARQHPRLAERCQRRGDAVGGERGRRMLFEHTVS